MPDNTYYNTYHTVHHAESDHDSDTLPLHGGLLDIFTDLLRRLLDTEKEHYQHQIHTTLIIVTIRTRPKGPSLGARAEAEPISPPTAFMMTTEVHEKEQMRFFDRVHNMHAKHTDLLFSGWWWGSHG